MISKHTLDEKKLEQLRPHEDPSESIVEDVGSRCVFLGYVCCCNEVMVDIFYGMIGCVRGIIIDGFGEGTSQLAYFILM